MGYDTRFSGRITVTPPLNPEEISYLTRFASTRRMLRSKGPYYVRGGGSWGQAAEPDILDSGRPSEDQPGLWCQWLPTDDGNAIVADEESEKFYDADRWMLYLITTFLSPEARIVRELADPVPGRDYPEEFAHFTFDHALNGVLDARGEYEDDVWRLIVRDNQVYYQDGTLDENGRVTYQTEEVLVTLARGRPPM